MGGTGGIAKGANATSYERDICVCAEDSCLSLNVTSCFRRYAILTRQHQSVNATRYRICRRFKVED